MKTRLLMVVLLLCGLGSSLYSTVALAKDYDRNDVSGREIGLVLARTALNGGPFATLLRGVARRHTRFFYVATEVMIGTTVEPTFYGSIGGAVGLETAQDAYQRTRGYIELGASAQWSRSTIFELLKLHMETGVRLQLQTTARPHAYAYLGVRGMTTFSNFGVGMMGGVGWTFD